jgi:hypothetical protein
MVAGMLHLLAMLNSFYGIVKGRHLECVTFRLSPSLFLYGKQHELHKANNFKAAKQEFEKNKKRIVALDKLIESTSG